MSKNREAARRLRARIENAGKKEAKAGSKPLERMNKAQLQAFAKELGIEIVGTESNKELIAMIEEVDDEGTGRTDGADK